MQRLSWTKKLCFSVITTLVFFGLLEACLWIGGIEPVSDTTDPFVGFSSRFPLFEPAVDAQGQAVMQTAQNKLNWFNDQSFPRKKARARIVFFASVVRPPTGILIGIRPPSHDGFASSFRWWTRIRSLK